MRRRLKHCKVCNKPWDATLHDECPYCETYGKGFEDGRDSHLLETQFANVEEGYKIRFKTHRRIVPVLITTSVERYDSCYNIDRKEIVLVPNADLESVAHEFIEAVVHIFDLKLSHLELSEITVELIKLLNWWSSYRNLTYNKGRADNESSV